MKHTLEPNQSSFFNHHHYLELEGLLKEADCDKLLALTNGILLAKGRDLWLGNEWIRSLSMRKTFSHFAKELFNSKFLRLAFDQLIHTGTEEAPLFQNNLPLNTSCSFQSLSGALILRLTEANPPLTSTEPLCPLPQKRGNGIFFSAQLPIDWKTLFSLPNETLWLIAYCPINTLFIYNENDPFTHQLKRVGYVFGDRLHDERHPLLK